MLSGILGECLGEGRGGESGWKDSHSENVSWNEAAGYVERSGGRKFKKVAAGGAMQRGTGTHL